MKNAYDDINEQFDNWEKNVKDNPDLSKEERDSKFWDMAVELFNDHIAGDIVTASGKVIHTPKIERS